MAKRNNLRCLDDPGILELAECLRAISDPNRLRILCLLMRGERCVCEVERELGISQQLASHHLHVLREAGFLDSKRVGTSTYYAVAGSRLDNLMDIMHRYFRSREAEEGEAAGHRCGIGPSSSCEASKMLNGPRSSRAESRIKAWGGAGR